MIGAGDVKLMHDRLIAVECREPYDSTIVDEACDMLLALDDEVRRTRAALKEIAQLEAHYAETPRTVALARAALGCKRSNA